MSNATATAAPRQRKPRVKPARSIRLCVGLSPISTGIVRITSGKVAHDYLLSELVVDFGRGFRLKKMGEEEAYHVNIDGDRRLCDCPGHSSHGHCKHADGLAALIAAGRI